MDKVKIGFPIEYEDKNNIVRNGLFLREPEIKELEKRLKKINKLTDLEQQCKKQKEVIDEAIEYINKYESIKAYYEYIDEDGYDEYNYEEDLKEELLDILKEVNK